MPTFTNPSVLPNGTVGVPYSVTFNIDKQGDTSYPYVVTLATLIATIPPGLTNGIHQIKNINEDDFFGGGTPQFGETIIGLTSGAKGVYIFPGVGTDIPMKYLQANNLTFSIGEEVDGEITGQLGFVTIPGVTPSTPPYVGMSLPPTLIPLSLFDDVNWTMAGTPTTAGVYNFSLFIFDGNTNRSSPMPFQITINDAPIPPTPKTKNRTGAPAFVRCPDEIIFKADVQHPQVKYCNNNIYNFYGVDENGLLHYIKSTSNISQRNTRNWWSLSI